MLIVRIFSLTEDTVDVFILTDVLSWTHMHITVLARTPGHEVGAGAGVMDDSRGSKKVSYTVYIQ